jgi:two-component system nitrogen regulation response regulator NtrX
MAHDILIVDDETDIRRLIAGVLEDEGYGREKPRMGAALSKPSKRADPVLSCSMCGCRTASWTVSTCWRS